VSDYYQSAIGITITRKRALLELRRHSIFDYKEFFKDLGDRDFYSARTVLGWLGY
jgi:hypothetical protein